ncbi:MAG TPA: APC family permease [Acidimicrobiia bacterium]|nr:APC family permease [Acidimicrobiia bacterium]
MTHQPLRRELGLAGAIVVGLGSILGTGAFVSIGLASSQWGDAVLLAIPLAGLLAVFNGLSSAYLAGRFPVAGGTYEFAYETVGPALGFTAGWLFLLAKTASAASAALGIAVYLGWGDAIAVAVGATIAMTGLVITGLRRTTVVNTVLVTLTILALVAFTWAGLTEAGGIAVGLLSEEPELVGSILPAIAFLFVAYTGYGRVATLGEEVTEPEHTIPRAVIVTLVVAGLLYMGVELGGRALGGPTWGSVLEFGGLTPATILEDPYRGIVTVGAVTAMAGVLLNLVLGLSRVWLAMGRRGDMPARLSLLDAKSQPLAATVLSGITIALVCLLGDIRLAWSFSGFTVLLYYGITNLAALKLDRRRWTAWAGLASCVLLSFFVTIQVWLIGIGLVLLGLLWHRQRRS